MNPSRRMARLEEDLERAERLLHAVDTSAFFRLLRWPGRIWRDWRGWLGQQLLHSPLHPLYLKLVPPAAREDAYLRWIAQERSIPAVPTGGPLISVLVPVHNPVRVWLEAAVESVRRQSYPCWQLCVCDDASREPWVWEYLSGLAAADSRVRIARAETNLGIAGATNRAGALSEGAWLAFMDQDDMLASDALAWVAAALEGEPADIIYTDEDRLDESGRRTEPIFKPDWSPELLLSCMYMGHLLVVRREAVEGAGWLRSACDGAQDHDLALRVAEAGGTVRHVPRVLYHWRKHARSTAAAAGAKSYTQAAGRLAVEEALGRRGIPAIVQDGPFPNTFRVRRQPSGRKSSIVICSRNPALVSECLSAIDRTTTYPHREIIVVQHLAGEPEAHLPCICQPYTGPFDFAAMNTLGARRASGEVLVFLNDDVAPLVPEWLEALVTQAERPEVGVAGARLVYPSGALQHAGMAVGIAHGTGHPQRDTFGAGYWPWWGLTREVSAVTGACLAIRKTVFEQLGGFDTGFPVNFNDADLCLRARAAGYSVIYEAAALLRHDECRTRGGGVRFAERELWRERWGGVVDPYYNRNLSREDESAGLRGPDDNTFMSG